ncbi:hypothetical protein M0R45_024383 [Rubus argutus]|uniref:MHC class I antigen n=1 Tax=Rubus argutus TaxID=59490 RepID=A0AAW1WR00_RUBAR
MVTVRAGHVASAGQCGNGHGRRLGSSKLEIDGFKAAWRCRELSDDECDTGNGRQRRLWAEKMAALVAAEFEFEFGCYDEFGAERN